MQLAPQSQRRSDTNLLRAFGPTSARKPQFGLSSSPRFGVAARIIRDDSGVAGIEYALICALIALAVVTGILELGGKSDQMWTEIEAQVTDAMDDSGEGGGKKDKKDKEPK